MHRRHAFTLIEMMVAMALTLFLMVIVSTAFVTGLETFRALKGLGDLQEGLQTASQRLRSDLAANHFDGRTGLSSPSFWNNGRQTQGYFRIEQIAPNPKSPNVYAIPELVDLDSPAAPPWYSYRAISHRLQFTVRLIGSRQQDQFYANIPNLVADPNGGPNPFPVWSMSPFNPNGKDSNGNPTFKRSTYYNQPPDTFYQKANSYTCQWAEIGYHLVKTGTTGNWEDATTPYGTPLYSLYRLQRVLVPDNSQLSKTVPPNDPKVPQNDPKVVNAYVQAYGEMSCEPNDPNNPAWVYFNTPGDVAQGKRSIAFPTDNSLEENNTTSPYSGASLLLTNVVSFQVQVLIVGDTDFKDVNDVNGGQGGIFDTASGQALNIAAIQIKLRVWDPATLQTRQITVIQEM